MKTGFTRTLITSSLVALSLNACSCERSSTESAAPPADPAAPSAASAKQAAPGMQLEEELRYDVVPSPAQTAMALSLANQLMIQGKLEEAEVRYKVAAAGGSAEAEKMLVKIRTESAAKASLDSARQKFQYGDYAGARTALRQVPATSMLRKSADALMDQIQEKEAAEQKALEASIQQGLNKADGQAPDEGGAAAAE